MAQKYISIRGAKEHNLKGIDVKIPRDKLVVITGLSGSGKSSLAFDTIYAEGQRKYVESLSAYARQFLDKIQKPDVEQIEGLPPTIAIEQRIGGHNPRSTVATTTEIYDYMRLLFARVGDPYCYKCQKPITTSHPGQIADALLALPENSRIQICAPLIRGQKGEHVDILQKVQREGFVRIRIDGELYEIKNTPALNPKKVHTIESVIDRLVIKPSVRSRLVDSIEIALKLGDGLTMVLVESKKGEWKEIFYSEKYACLDHPGASLPELSPRCFSFNSPYGACPSCDGLGNILEFDINLIIPEPSLALSEGAIDAWRHGGKRMNIFYAKLLRKFCRAFKVDIDTPFKALPAKARRALIEGTTKGETPLFEGVVPNLTKRFQNTDSVFVKARLHSYLSEQPCGQCHGARLRQESLAVLIDGKNINALSIMSIKDANLFFGTLKLSKEKEVIAKLVLKELRDRLSFLDRVGLSYLSLSRTSGSLSGGEAQRIRLATQIGSSLVGVCYVLDEPSIGLHQRDNERLIQTLRKLSDLGNTVIVVEHDEETMEAADCIFDIGPKAGAQGGQVVAYGSIEDIKKEPTSLTGMYLSGAREIKVPSKRRKVNLKNCIELKEVTQNNLQNVTVQFPLEVMTCVTGVSGSGKSSLVRQVLLPAMKRAIYNSKEKPGLFKKILGMKRIDKVIEIDQSPIGRTPRSNPATYTGVFDLIRALFTKTREAKIRGYKPGRFSFNVKGGRCEDCQGAGTKKIEMHFLPDVYVECESCQGARYNSETLDIRFKGKNIADILAMAVSDALIFFDNFPKIKQLLQALKHVGLGYITLGQASTTLSGGEAQRVKLASELGKPNTSHTFYILDEPTTGLHFSDIHNLLNVLERLVNLGNTIVVIEHNLDVIKMADHIIDLGPDGGIGGGHIIAIGTPEEVVNNKDSVTGKYLKNKLPGTRKKVVKKIKRKKTVKKT